MKKIGITTITGARSKLFNYGNIFQNYALSYYLRKQSFTVMTIYYDSIIPQFTLNKFNKKREKENFMQRVDDIFRVIKRNYQKKKLIIKKEHRDNGFIRFIEQYLIYTKNTYNVNSNLEDLNKQFDYFITGSDQVWNPYYEGANEFFYLSFADKKKRITYAPSIGVNHIPSEMKEKMGRWLTNFEFISIRENEGKEILKNNYGIDSLVVCDPVFLLNKKEWLELINSEQVVKKPYFAVYILGKKNIKTKKNIKQMELKYGLKAVDIYTRDNPDSLFCTPTEFLEVFYNSEFIVTDSFHAVAFSIIFEKPIIVIDRNTSLKMSGRIENLLQLAGLKNRNIKDILFDKSKLNEISDLENSKLNKLITLSKEYLLNSLKCENI